MQADIEAEPTETLLTGWGRTAPTRSVVYSPHDTDELTAMFEDPPARGLIGRGLGRSYGDAAQNAGGVVLSSLEMANIGPIDEERGEITVEGGVTFDDLLKVIVPLGWFPPVTPGTRFITVGGAIAADIHGKNHHCDGSFCSHVESMTIRTGSGVVRASQTENADLFWATAGGMGLTGFVINATVKLLRISTPTIRIDTERARDLDDLMSRMESGDHNYRYSVAWIDCLIGGSSLGRGVLTRGDHAQADELKGRKRKLMTYAPREPVGLPVPVPGFALNRATVRAFNELWYRKAPGHEREALTPLAPFFYPLDSVEQWNRFYGPRGFVQYQFAVPPSSHEVVRRVIESLSRSKTAPFLAVLKRFGASNEADMSFPMPGWTLAVDLPVRNPDLAGMLHEFDRMVAEVGGRIYLAKDARLRADVLEVMYPNLARWREVKSRWDPEGVMRSDLARRLGLN
jgi:decaprenylphospho-beta-D-ribofuranose 2-oxidase